MAKKRNLDDVFLELNAEFQKLINDFSDKEKTEENGETFNSLWQNIVFKVLKMNVNSVKKQLCEDTKLKAVSFAEQVEYVSEFNNFSLTTYHTEIDNKTKSLMKLSLPEYWRVFDIQKDAEFNCVKVTFGNTAVNSGKDLVGYVFLSPSGKVKHLFTHIYSF